MTTNPYSPVALATIPALLNLLDREVESATYGSFDREHWAWKFRDFPLGMLQTAVYPLALAWKIPFPDNPYHQNPRVLEWILGSIDATVRRQHRSGAFDAFAPNERDPGPTLGVMHGLAEAFRLVREEAPADWQDRVTASVVQAATYGLDRTETHAFVSNHWGLFAVAFHDAWEISGEDRFRTRGESVVDRILQMQSPDGWYHEYGGPDPGYESLGIFHLATYWERSGAAAVLASLIRSVECYSHFVHPDGSVGGVYGSRNTGLYFPGGFERLATAIPAAAAVAGFMRSRLPRGNVLGPAHADAENLPSLLYTYLEAARCCVDSPREGTASVPCETLDGARLFEDAQIIVASTPRYFAVLSGAKGGVCRVFDKRYDAVAYEDAGYVLHDRAGQWTTQRLGLGAFGSVSEDARRVECAAASAAVSPLTPTPARFVALRLLNLTAFRSAALGRWLRTFIVRRLITGLTRGPYRVARIVRFELEEITFHDRLEGKGDALTAVTLPRQFTPIHMGSAKYFAPAELAPLPRPALDGAAASLSGTGRADILFTLRFADGAPCELVNGPSHSTVQQGNTTS